MAAVVNTILVPTDFSATSDAALAYAKSLATCLEASLHLVHVFTDPYAPAAFAPDVYAPIPADATANALEEARRNLVQRLDDRELKRFRGTRNIVTGLTATEIVRYAADHGVDLIVMGTHGRRGVAHLLLGSVAEHVVRTARCPVLTVRAPKEAVSEERPVGANTVTHVAEASANEASG
jgi:nucleotide-binding universal stress UspA family protein